MAEMTPKKRALLCMTGNKKRADRISNCPVITTVTVEQMDAVNAHWPEANRDPELNYKLAAAAWDIAGIEGFKVPFDTCIEAEALGCGVNWGRVDRNPSIESHAFKTLESFRVPENLLETGRFPMKYYTMEKLHRNYGDTVPIVHQLIGPMTLAGHLFGIEQFCIWIKKKPIEQVKEALMRIADINIMDGRRSICMGADVISIGDPSATSDILSPAFFRDVMVPVYKYISSKMAVPYTLHICGNTMAYLPYLPDSGIDLISVDAQVDLGFARKILGKKVGIGGSIPTISALLFGTPKQVTEAAMHSIRSGVDVLMPACGIPPRTPLANIRAMTDAAKCMIYV
jgi:[methyl-Co(III) methanol-specific corrinoid protein]:coenzyme M methyltransferase